MKGIPIYYAIFITTLFAIMFYISNGSEIAQGIFSCGVVFGLAYYNFENYLKVKK